MAKDYLEEAQAEFEKRQRREIERIAEELKEEDELKARREKQRNCSHPDYYIGSRSEHYQTRCVECGKALL